MRPHLAVLLTSCVMFLAGCAEGPDSAIEQYHRSIEKGDLAAAKALMSKQALEQIRAYGARGEAELTSAFASESEKYRNCGGIQSVKVNLAGEGETRSGTTNIAFKKNGQSGCEALNQDTILVKEDGAWKILK